MLRNRLLGLLIGLALTISARADALYTFTFTATSGPFVATTFQVEAPSFLTGGVYSITPFTISDGSNSFDVTQMSVGALGNANFCFDFGTAVANLSSCGAFFFAGTPLSAFISSEFPGALPSSPGNSFTSNADVSANVTSSELSNENSGGTLNLSITEVPEPATAPVVGIVLLAGFAASILRKSPTLSVHPLNRGRQCGRCLTSRTK